MFHSRPKLPKRINGQSPSTYLNKKMCIVVYHMGFQIHMKYISVRERGPPTSNEVVLLVRVGRSQVAAPRKALVSRLLPGVCLRVVRIIADAVVIFVGTFLAQHH